MLREQLFLNKNVKLVKNDGWVLYGTVLDMNEEGLVLATDQTTGWHAMNNIRELTLDE